MPGSPNSSSKILIVYILVMIDYVDCLLSNLNQVNYTLKNVSVWKLDTNMMKIIYTVMFWSSIFIELIDTSQWVTDITSFISWNIYSFIVIK